MKIKLRYKILIFLILISVGSILYSRYLGTSGLIVKEYNVINNKIPESFYGLKIVQFSDIYYKSTIDKSYLDSLSKEINRLDADILIFTGDIFDPNIKYTEKDIEILSNFFKSLKSNIESFAIKGDNDIEHKQWESIINQSSFTNLNDNYKYIYYKGSIPILITGISSNNKKNHILDSINEINNNLKKEYSYSILILHEPDYIKNIDYKKFNLILAGHSLNGQIVIPYVGGIIKDKGSLKYHDNYYKLETTKLYVSSGIGVNNNYKFRLFNKPSVNLYRLRNK